MANYNSTHTGQIIDATISAVIAGKAGIQGVKVNGTEITPDSSSNKVDINVPIVAQTTGTSTSEIMSQKATTDALDLKANSSTLSTVATSGSYNDLSNKPSIPSVVQVTGTSTSDVMSQDAVTTQLGTKVDQVSGKGLSTNDFTNGYKDKLDGLSKVSVNSYSMILSAASWSSTAPYTYTITSSSTTSSDEPIFDIELSSNTSTAISELESWGYVSKADTSNGQITFTCLETKPTVDLPVKMLVIKYA